MTSPSEASGSRAGSPTGTIHDLGYRPYRGPRLSRGAVAWSLFLTGLRNCFGLGRSGRSKILPMLLLGVMVLPAVILVGILVQARQVLGLDDQLVDYSAYSSIMMLIVTVFVASQAPALISRDLRFRTITLYLARPLSRSTYVLVRLASLTAAVFVLLAAPLLVMYAGGLLAELPAGKQTTDFASALAGVALLSVLLATTSGLVSAVSTRRGLAGAAVIVVLLVGFVAASTIIGIAQDTDHDRVAAIGGVLSPFTLVDGFSGWAFDTDAAAGVRDPDTTTGVGYLMALLIIGAGSVAAMLLRYRRAAAG